MNIIETKTLKTDTPDFARAHSSITLNVDAAELNVIRCALAGLHYVTNDGRSITMARMMNGTIEKHVATLQPFK